MGSAFLPALRYALGMSEEKPLSRRDGADIKVQVSDSQTEQDLLDGCRVKTVKVTWEMSWRYSNRLPADIWDGIRYHVLRAFLIDMNGDLTGAFWKLDYWVRSKSEYYPNQATESLDALKPLVTGNPDE